MSGARAWMLARLTGALVPPERAELELDAYRDEVRVEDAAEIASLRGQVAELLVERHSTNEALSDAAVELRVQRGRIAELPDRLAAALTERFTSLGNPFSEMRTQFQGPDGWPASKPVGPNGVAEVLGGLLSEPTPETVQALQPKDPHDGPLHHDYALLKVTP
ncbi:hypothetical protein [Streptomyces sp. NPDC094049]|uniref:hypothetical protein n=1 Tax=Streptomyces sp. NPDC094049 TaxID=3154987 RepID=UPI00332F856E